MDQKLLRQLYRSYLRGFLDVNGVDREASTDIPDLYARALAAKVAPLSPKRFARRIQRDIRISDD